MFCPKCGGSLDQNGACPNCSNPKKRKLPTWAIVLIAVFGGLIVIGIIGNIANDNKSSGSSSSPSVSDSADSISDSESESSSESSESEPEEEVVKVSAFDLYAAYDANEVAAEQKYKGKLLEITGTVDNISRDILNDLYVTLKSDDNEYSIASVQCYINEKDENTMSIIASFAEGDTVIIRGYVGSMLVNLSVNDCIIVE